MSDPKLLEGTVDVSSLRPGPYFVRTDQPVYSEMLAAVALGLATETGRLAELDGESIVFFDYHGLKSNPFGRKNPPEEHGVMVVQQPWDTYINVPNRDYSNWKMAWWREVIQNSVDAGATSIELGVRTMSDGTSWVYCADNGSGMDLDILVKKFFTLGPGGSTKSGSGAMVGGFGEAKKLILFAWPEWKLYTRDIRVTGEYISYRPSSGNEHRPGVLIQVHMPAQKTTNLIAAKKYIRDCSIPGVRFLVVERDEQNKILSSETVYADADRGDLVTEFPRAKVYYNKNRARSYEWDPNVNFTTENGLFMFSKSFSASKIPGTITVELTGKMIGLLTSNRDGILDNEPTGLARSISEFASKLAADLDTALKSKRKLIRKKYVDESGRGKLRSNDMTLAIQAGFRADMKKKSDVGFEFDRGSVESLLKRLNDAATEIEQAKSEGYNLDQPAEDAERVRRFLARPADSSVVEIVSNTTLTGREGYEKMMKQLVWQPDFYVYSEFDGFDIPARFLPETMSPTILKLAKAWAEVVRSVLIQLESDIEYGVGFIFSDSVLAAYLYDGGHWIMINPFKDLNDIEALVSKRRRIEDVDLLSATQADDVKWLFAAAVHEVTHCVDNVSEHDREFASAITKNIGKTADMFWMVKRIVKEAIKKDPEARKARAATRETSPTGETKKRSRIVKGKIVLSSLPEGSIVEWAGGYAGVKLSERVVAVGRRAPASYGGYTLLRTVEDIESWIGGDSLENMESYFIKEAPDSDTLAALVSMAHVDRRSSNNYIVRIDHPMFGAFHNWLQELYHRTDLQAETMEAIKQFVYAAIKAQYDEAEFRGKRKTSFTLGRYSDTRILISVIVA